MPRRKTHDEFIHQVKHLPLTVTERYTGNRQRIGVMCDECGHNWKMRVDHILAGKGCPECQRRSQMKTEAQYSDELRSVGIELVSKYKNRKTAVSMKCMECGHLWNAIPAGCKKNCPACAAVASGEKSRKPPEDFYIIGDVAYVNVGSCTMEIDADDFKLLDRAVMLDGNDYPYMKNSGKRLYVHKLIMPEQGKAVDHRDRNPLNNKRSNLRYATKSQNAMNSKVRSDSKTGIRGVSYNKKSRKWSVNICKDGIVSHLGTFDNIDIAIGVRRQAEKELFGEYAPIS